MNGLKFLGGGSKPIRRLFPRYMCAVPPKVEVFINDERVLVDPGTTIMRAASMVGVEIPRFCYHEKLSIAGNCRMCLVEVEKMPKPVAACAMPVMNGWKVKTDSDMAKKAREGVMEFLLINHPLDCPICDQGGECDLQDQSMACGNDKSRFIESQFTGKRAVENKDIGPLIKTIMTRCIHCTRCIRFMSEIAGVDDLGTTCRGSDMEIGTYVDKMIKSELSGNIIDVCPVGALTSKPNQFAYRPWEMRRFESIDVSDAVGCNIIVGVRTSDVMRVLPRPFEAINEDWICDKARFSYDGLKYQRLMSPMAYDSPSSTFTQITWRDALVEISKKWRQADKDQSYGVVGQLVDAESTLALRELFHRHDCENLYTEDVDHPQLRTGVDFRCTYLLNSPIARIEEADVLLIVGACLRYEAPLMNARVRKSFIHHNLKVAVLGEPIDATFNYEHLGKDSKCLDQLLQGTHSFSKTLNAAKRPLIILGTKSARESYGASLHNKCMRLANELGSKIDQSAGWNVFGVMQRHAGYVNALDMGYLPGAPDLRNASFLYLLGADGGLIKAEDVGEKCFVVYQGHHGDHGAQLADIVLPGSAYTEKQGIYVNTEGRAQRAMRCVTSPGEAREDWKIIRAISEMSDNPLPFNTVDELRARLSEISPHFATIGQTQPCNFQKLAEQMNQSSDVPFENLPPHISKLADYFMTNSISRNSRTMAECVTQVLTRN